MKYTITISTDDNFERDAIMQAVENKLKLDNIYNDIFRPVIKYSVNEKEIEAFELVWEKLNIYLSED